MTLKTLATARITNSPSVDRYATISRIGYLNLAAALAASSRGYKARRPSREAIAKGVDRRTASIVGMLNRQAEHEARLAYITSMLDYAAECEAARVKLLRESY